MQRYQWSKLEVERNFYQSARFEPMCPGSAELADIFSEPQLWPLVSLQPLDQNQCLVPHLKDLFHICLGDKAQGFWMTFNICNLGSKYPYFNRAYVVSSGLGCPHLYMGRIFVCENQLLVSSNFWTFYYSYVFATRCLVYQSKFGIKSFMLSYSMLNGSSRILYSVGKILKDFKM